ncbi:MAG: hypothetical protein GX316_07795 [Firmicutes bacterium]|nr:hypothetical protein [Bacillota bacterium]
MKPEDVIWRLLEQFAMQLQLLDESQELLDPKKQEDLMIILGECEQLTRTQINILRRIGRRYGVT